MCSRTGIRILAVAALAAAPGMALAGGSQARSGGGAEFQEVPRISSVDCLRRCASRDRARPGSTVRVLGAGFSKVRSVTFHGGAGRGDDVAARARPGSARRIDVKVPLGAGSGPVSAQVSAELRSKRSRSVAILPPPPPQANPTLTPVPGPRQSGAPRLETGTSSTRAFVGALRAVTFSFRVTETAATDLEVQLVRGTDGKVVRTWRPATLGPGYEQRIVWNGRSGSRSARPGRYSFRLTASGASGATARSATAQHVRRDSFDLYDHVFPVRGRHDFGGSNADFGSGRSGHSHQGHDLFAGCGTRVVAARGGRVEFKAYHRAAGNYLVIDGDGTGVDYVYMHLAQPTPFRRGDRVYTGQQIGAVGETGNARGCHLHYEMWGSPGWYDGGRPFDPLPSLRAWDRWS